MFLLPPRLDEWLPADHLVYFVREVVEELDLSSIYGGYELEEGGQPPHDPRMMVGLLRTAEPNRISIRHKRLQPCLLRPQLFLPRTAFGPGPTAL
jgi:hypothetical protein